jgi:hypothetical protein
MTVLKKIISVESSQFQANLWISLDDYAYILAIIVSTNFCFCFLQLATDNDNKTFFVKKKNVTFVIVMDKTYL